MKKNSQIGLKAAILTMSLIQMATNAIASVIGQIAASFPDVPVSAVQYLMTFPNLVLVAVSLVSAKLTERISKKYIAIGGLVFGCLAGLFSFLFHGNIMVLYIWAAFLGIGMGCASTMANSLIAEYFDGNERESMLGWQTSASNLGSMIMTFAGGYLAVLGWQYVYLVYFLGLIGIVCSALFIPGRGRAENVPAAAAPGRDSAEGKSKKIPGRMFLYFGIAFFYMMMFYAGPTNLALIVEERALGSTVLSGYAATVLLLGGVLTGLIFGKLAGKIGKMTIPLGFFALVLGYLLIYFLPNVPVLMIGSFLIGGSMTLAIPQCMGSVVTKDSRQSTMLMAICMGIANVGMFLAPCLTGLARILFGNSLASTRFLFTGILSAFFMVLSAVLLLTPGKEKTK